VRRWISSAESVDYEEKVLALDRPVRFAAGDGVSLAFTGKAPDVGPCEHKAGPAAE
jgi:hypothetical protein